MCLLLPFPVSLGRKSPTALPTVSAVVANNLTSDTDLLIIMDNASGLCYLVDTGSQVSIPATAADQSTPTLSASWPSVQAANRSHITI